MCTGPKSTILTGSAALDALPGGEDILMYGEPWQGGSTRMEHGAIPANKQAAGLLDSRIGFFCDNTRDAIKGGVFNAGSAGYINGDMHCGYQVLHSIPARWSGGFYAPGAGPGGAVCFGS